MKVPPLKSARFFSYLMILVIILAIIGISYVSVIAQQILSAKSLETDHARIDSAVAEQEILKLKSLKSALERNKPIVHKTAQIVAESQSYTFQDQVINDLSSYADKSGVHITLIDFGPKPGDKPQAGPGAISTLNRTEIILQLANATPYSNVLTFIRSIEENITKIQITGVNMVPLRDDKQLISNPVIKLEVYLR